MAKKEEIPVEMVMTAMSQTNFIEELSKPKSELKNQGLAAIKASLTQIDAEKAEASVPADAKQVKDQIRSTVGFENVNEEVKDSMLTWMHQVFTQEFC